MSNDSSGRDDERPEADPTGTIDLEHAERVRIGVTRGEENLEVGPPRDYPDRADVSVRSETNGEGRVVVSLDAMAGDHGRGVGAVEE